MCEQCLPIMENKSVEKYTEIWQNNGKYFGYPQCCIDFFIKRGIAVLNGDFNSIKLSPEHENLSIKTGFIPCCLHAEKIINKEIKVEDLIKNRESINIFPYD